jgi:putative SOS response-associated peptidase YedK
MCGRFTVKATWAELDVLYRLTLDAPPHNLRPRYNVCPTDPVDVVTANDGRRELVTMRWGLVPLVVEQAAKGNAGGDVQL